MSIGSTSGFTQAEVKGSSFVDLPFGPDASTVLSDDALHRGQSDTSAFKLLVAMKPLKCSEKLIRVFRVESCAVVTNKEDKLPVDCRLVNLNDRSLTAAAIFDGIGQKVREHLLDQSGVAIDRRQGPYPPVNLSVGGFGFEVVANVLNQ